MTSLFDTKTPERKGNQSIFLARRQRFRRSHWHYPSCTLYVTQLFGQIFFMLFRRGLPPASRVS